MSSEEMETQKFTKRQIKYLQGKHRELDKIIGHNEQDESPESWQLVKSLKKKRLAIKDQIVSLKKSLFKSEL